MNLEKDAQRHESENKMRPEKPYYGSLAKEKLIKALLDLMKKYPFNEITILQISQEAAIARRTFYLYYKSKIDILNDYYDALAKEYYDNISDEVLKDTYAQAVQFFLFWNKHRSYLNLLYKQDMLYVLMSSLSNYLKRTVEENDKEKMSEYYISFYSGGLMSMLITWTENGFKEKPEALARIATSFNYLDVFKNNPI